MHERIVILDFGSQVTKLIARRVRESGVYSEIHPCTVPVSEVETLEPYGLILSGGPNSVFDTDAPQIDPKMLDLQRSDGSPVPVLGICYGLQAMAHLLGGAVEGAERREFGRAQLFLDTNTGLFENVEDGSTVWMSHGDSLTELPEGYIVTAHTDNAPIAAVRSSMGASNPSPDVGLGQQAFRPRTPSSLGILHPSYSRGDSTIIRPSVLMRNR